MRNDAPKPDTKTMKIKMRGDYRSGKSEMLAVFARIAKRLGMVTRLEQDGHNMAVISTARQRVALFEINRTLEMLEHQDVTTATRAAFDVALAFAFAEGGHIDPGEFIKAWREGDTSKWPQFPPASVESTRATFNAAINFALDQDVDGLAFLRAWREGDCSEWPEFKGGET